MPNSSTIKKSDTFIPLNWKPTKPGASSEKKDKHCQAENPEDAEQGSYWDHVLFDPETRLVISLVVGRHGAEAISVAFTDYFNRTDGTLPELICTDGFAAYESVILDTYGVWLEEMELTETERQAALEAGCPERYFPVEITYATIIKERAKGRVVRIEQTVVLGTQEQADASLANCEFKSTINISHLERWNGTQRHFNARKARKVCTFSKELDYHIWVTWLVVVWYNFCWCVRTLREKLPESEHYQQRTPAMAAGLTDRP